MLFAFEHLVLLLCEILKDSLSLMLIFLQVFPQLFKRLEKRVVRIVIGGEIDRLVEHVEPADSCGFSQKKQSFLLFRIRVRLLRGEFSGCDIKEDPDRIGITVCKQERHMLRHQRLDGFGYRSEFGIDIVEYGELKGGLFIENELGDPSFISG